MDCVGPMTIDQQVSMTVVLYPPDNRKRDVDNYMKPLLDSITKSGLWMDDSLVDQLLIYRGSVVKGGKVWVRLDESIGLILDSDIYRENIE
jgi:crossover junction endodeoxyribonuclease RusA